MCNGSQLAMTITPIDFIKSILIASTSMYVLKKIILKKYTAAVPTNATTVAT